MTIGLMALTISVVYAGPLADNRIAGTTSISTAVSNSDLVGAASSSAPSMIIKVKGKKGFKGKRWRGHWGHGWGHGWHNDPWYNYNNGYVRKCWWNGYKKVCKYVPQDPYWDWN